MTKAGKRNKSSRPDGLAQPIGWWTYDGDPCAECAPPAMPRKAPSGLLWACGQGHTWHWYRKLA